MSNDPKSRIRSVMSEQGHTYRSIGEMIGITPQAVSEIVNGRTEGATARYALATALGVEVEDLWPEDEGDGEGSADREERPREAAPAARSVSVAICCPKEGRPSSVELGVDGGAGPAGLRVVRCEHFPGRALDCDMECLDAAE